MKLDVYSNISTVVLSLFFTMNIVAPEKADAILQSINKFIGLDKSESQIAHEYLKGVLNQLLSAMRKKNDMFNKYYRKEVWAGSYWDNLKVSRPDEYDVDIVMAIPTKLYDLEVYSSKGNSGFVKVRLQKKEINQATEWEKFVDCNKSLLQNKFRQWFEGVVIKGLEEFPRANYNSWLFKVTVQNSERECKVQTSKSGPAMTLIVSAEKTFSVDLVPVIEMTSWPPPPFSKHIRETEKQNWFIVPKPKKDAKSDDSWRCSFLYHERILLHDTLIWKPVLKLVKKFRDRQRLDNISSYYIKTIFMWETLKHKNNRTFFKTRQIDLFLHMLSTMRDYFGSKTIPYFWNKQFNLLNDWEESTCQNIYGKINNILLKIQRNIKNDPSIIITILLTDSEAERFNNRCFSQVQDTSQNQENEQPRWYMEHVLESFIFFSWLITAPHQVAVLPKRLRKVKLNGRISHQLYSLKVNWFLCQ